MNYNFDYSKDKDLILKDTRGIGFEEVIEAVKKGDVLDDIDHFDKKRYPSQRIYIVRIANKVYAVPYVFDKARKIVFLKTIYPSRKLKKMYLKKYEKKN